MQGDEINFDQIINNNKKDNQSKFCEDLTDIKRDILNNSCAANKAINPELYIEDTLIEKLITKDNIYYLIFLYDISSTLIKRKIESIIKEYFAESFSSDIYFDVVIRNIIKPEEYLENKLLDKLKSLEHKEHTSLDNRFEILLEQSVNLYLVNKLLHSDAFIPYFKMNDYIEFLFDYAQYDYSKFKIEWLTQFNDRLLIKLAAEARVKTEIGKIYKAEHLAGNLSEGEFNILFKYFI